ncbi:MAG: FG-GAP-like repeat-containing protein, partial [Petrotogales bacterium]
MKKIVIVFLILSLAISTAAAQNNSDSAQLKLKTTLDIPANVVHVADLNNDGKNEFIVGTTKIGGFDYLYLYKYVDSDYERIWSYKIPDDGKKGGITTITVGDTDNDKEDELIVSTGQPSDTGGDRTLRIFKRSENSLDSFDLVYSHKIFDKTEPTSIKVGDADNDGDNELIVGVSLYAYIPHPFSLKVVIFLLVW